ncbi:hypothetical protein HG535_0G00900 [Zygotorulaspora mrakii]|uniref:Factor arrest protein 11 n=1 Tax=Zygotorulaspora mrakii TaxID=42260 RepID=A0A7H9B778_ZYGMR|nr:uncharacterized protein HG535_0G00900 [Zygotorulaspora mrakii]QLG74206.1 hypothetical protein HG535_0G00900 [Zygotorulaspora mrakii]
MSDERQRETPLRSVSLENLRPKSGTRKKLKFIDDTVTKHHKSRSFGRNDNEDEILKDLNEMLRTKLRIDTTIEGQLRKLPSTPSADQESFIKRSGIDGNVITVAYDDPSREDQSDEDENISDSSDQEETNGLDENANEDDDDFTNVDEIDGPISAKQKEVANGKLHSMPEVDYNLPVDSDLQEDLDRRAAEIEKSSKFEPVSLPRVEWNLQSFYSLMNDIPLWFCSSNFSYFPFAKDYFDRSVQYPIQFLNDSSYAEKIIAELIENVVQGDLSCLSALCYISMGTFGMVDTNEIQLENIRRNNLLLCRKLKELIAAFQKIAIHCRDDNSNLKYQTTMLFYSSTIIFFLVNVCIEQRVERKEQVLKVIDIIDESHLLQFLTRYIEHWRWNSRLSMRIRNIITLLFKLLILQFGDKNEYKTTKSYLFKFHELKHQHDKNSKRCTISPLHYEAFREDITARFPDYDSPAVILPTDGDNSNSLSQFLEITRSKVKNPINLTLAVPEQHIATPAPSPPQSPSINHMSDYSRSRKSFQTNMAYPCLYPSDDEDSDTFLAEKASCFDNDAKRKASKNTCTDVPFSIQEATKILSENLELKLSVKQLWHERKLFMMTERGWQHDHSQDPFNYLRMENTDEIEAIDIMKRVDSFYKDCLSGLNSLVFVLLQTIESNLSNVDYKKTDFDENNPIDAIMPRLEITRTKEISMESSTGILFLLLKWFKLNHVLKFEHFAVLLNDSKYVHICSTLLSKYSDHYTDKVFNETAASNCSFWRHCSLYKEAYTISFSQVDESKLSNEYNVTFLSSIAYLLKVLRKIIGNKTERLKELPLTIGVLFKKYYRVFNLDVYRPILRIIKELTPFKNKRWKSEHMELISGVFLYERLELIDNWVTGKDISGELSDACGQEIALRALLQFYNFSHYESSMEDLGYCEKSKPNLSLLNKEAEYLGI